MDTPTFMHVPIALVARADPSALEIRINFGVFTGREATPAELDELAQALLPDVAAVSIVSEQRHEVSEESEVAVHQVRIEVSGDQLPNDRAELDELCARLLAGAERWADICIADRSVEIAEL